MGIARAAAAEDLVQLGAHGRAVVEKRADWSRNSRMIREAYRLALAEAEGKPA